MRRSRPLLLLTLAGMIYIGACDSPTEGESNSAGGGSGSGGRAEGGATGTGGTSAAGGSTSSGGSRTGGNGGAGGTSPTGGSSTAATGSGGSVATGGRGGIGGAATGGGSGGGTGVSSSGGTTAAAGRTGTSVLGGASGGGGRTGTGGTAATGGTPGTGGRSATGGTTAVGGATAVGGTTGTGGTTTCNPTWDPPDTANGNTNLVSGLQQVWEHSGSVIAAAPNIKIFQIMANKGVLNYCARWQSDTVLTAADRKAIETLIGKCDKQWTDKLTGWGCWPYTDVTVKIVLWAVKSASVLSGWSDDEGKYVVNGDASCPTDCGPWDPKKSFANCSTVRYDEFFWLDGSLTDYTGWGSATGFYMGASAFLNAARSGANTETIVAHEMGHSHGLDDFYDWKPTGWSRFVMMAGSSTTVTDTDGWMLRDVWRHVRAKYGYPGP